MNQAVSETDSSMDEAMEGLHKESNEVFEEFKAKTTNDTEFRLRKLDDAFQAVIHTVQQFFGELENKIDEARTVAQRLEVTAKAEVPQVSEAEIEEVSDISKPDLKSEIAQLSEPVPEKEVESTGLKFKAPKFTPKTEEEYGEDSYIEQATKTEDETYGGGYDENDDFASFGGVEEESDSDLRGMDIMDMDFDTFTEGREAGRWTRDGQNQDDKS